MTEPYDPGTGAPGGREESRSLGDIVGDISQDLSTLVRQEMELAKTEIKEEVRKAGKGAGLLGGGGIAGYLTLLFLSVALMLLLDNWMPVELAALIVAVLWAVAAAVLFVRGRSEMKAVNAELPATRQTLKEDVQWAKAQKS